MQRLVIVIDSDSNDPDWSDTLDEIKTELAQGETQGRMISTQSLNMQPWYTFSVQKVH